MNGLLGLMGHWFGYVGSCVASPIAVCRPFFAFLALAVSGLVCLAVLLSALRNLARRDRGDSAEAAGGLRALGIQETLAASLPGAGVASAAAGTHAASLR